MIKRSVIAIMSAALLVALTVGGAFADHPANDGQRFSDQPPDVQALYTAVHGANADAQWVMDHNAAIGAPAPATTAPATVDRSSADWLSVNHVAWQRSGDLELAARIADSVIMRGTVDAFLAGTDMGVLYGYVPPAPAAPAPRAPSAPSAPSGGGGGGAAAPAAPRTGAGLFLRVPAPSDLTLVVDVDAGTLDALPETSVASPGYAASTYSLSGLPSGLEFDADTRVISGTPVYAGTYPVTYTAKQVDGDATDDGENNVNKKPELSSSLMFTITVVAESAPVFQGADQTAISLLAGSGMFSMTLNAATGGNGDLEYSIGDLSGGNAAWLKFDKATRVLSGTVPTAEHGAVDVTYTVADSDNVTGAEDEDSMTFSVTVTADSTPTLDVTALDEAARTATVGVHYILVLPEATDGNGKITYSVSGLPGGLDFNAGSRTINGTPSALPSGVSSQDFTVKYMAVDEDGDEADAVTVTITVNG